MGGYELDHIDHQILTFLHDDGRMPYDEIGNKLGISRNTVRRRVRDMEDAGIIKGFTVLTNPSSLGYIPVAFGLSAEAGRTDTIANELAEDEHVYKLWILSGRHNIIFHACFDDIQEFQAFNHEVVQNIKGITSFESSIATKALVDKGSIVLTSEETEDLLE